MSAVTEVLRCAVCSKEVRIVRLNRETLTLGHVVNPRNNRHAVRLSRAAADRFHQGSEDSQPQRRVPDPSAPERAGTRGDGARRPLRSDSDSLRAASSPARRACRGEGTPPASLPRSTRSAGSTAGEGV